MDPIRRIVRSKMFMEKHFGQELPLEKLAGEAFFSPYHYLRTFKKVYRTTPHRYLSGWRLHQARLLLDEGELSVSEVCEAVGFSSLASFSLLFKKRYRIPPALYRGRALKRKEEMQQQPLRFIPHCFIEAWRNSNFE